MGREERAAFDGRTAIVTGGASGIGRALGERLVELGAHVVLADVDGDAAERAAAELGDAAVGRALDVRDGDAFRALVDDVAHEHGAIDFLFNNAGISVGGPTDEQSQAHWDRVIDVNLRGVVHGVRAAYPRMIEQGHGHIVNTSSGAGLFAPPFVAAYAMTKFGVVGLCQALRPEAALHGVRVSVFCPGSVDTPILDHAAPADLPAPSANPMTGREFLGILGQKPVPADGVARSALAQVARNKAVVLAPASVRVAWYLSRFSPSLARAIANNAARKVDRRIAR